jgi:hypothetical protein
VAGYELTIKAISLPDLEQAIKDLNARFPGLEEGAEPEAVQQPRRPGRPRRVAAAAPAPAAGEAQAVQGGANGSDLGGAADGDAGAVEPEAADEGQGGPAAADDAGGAAPIPAGLDEGEAGAAAQGGAAAAGEASVGQTAVEGRAQSEEAGVGEEPAAEAPTLEGLKAATRDLIASKGVAAAQEVFGKLGIAKPGQTPEDKIPAAMAAVKRVGEVGLAAWLKEQG